VPSASAHPSRAWWRRPLTRAAVGAVCLGLLAAGFGGCETTQEKAERQQARATHILEQREKRQHHRNARKQAKKHQKEEQQ
jgi:uncharacterized protein HemX